MARIYTVSTGLNSVAASVTRVAVQLATPSTASDVKILQVECSGDSTGTGAGAIPFRLSMARETGASNTTGTAPTPAPWRKGSVASVVTARINDTVDGAGITVIDEWLVSPTSGIIIQFPLGREPTMDVSDFLCFRLITQVGLTTFNALTSITFEE
jgi:hypothetical protein